MSQQHPQPQPQFGMQQPPPPPGMGFGAPPPGWQGPGFPPGVPPPGMAPQPFPPHQFGPPGQQQQHYGPPGAMPPFGRPPGPMPPHMGAMPPHMMPPGFQQPPPGQQYQNFQPQQQQPPMRQQQAPQQAPPQNTPASIESERERQRRERERLVQQSTEDRQKQAMQQNEQMMMMGVVPPRPVQPPQQPARAPSPSRQDKQSRDRDRGDRDRSDRDRDRRDRDRDRGDRDRDRDRRDRDRSDRDRRDRDRDDRDNRERSDPGRDQRNDKQDKSASSSTTAQNKKPIAAPTTTNKQPTTRQQARAPPQFKFKKFENTLRNKSSFLVNMRFQSALPPVPFEPKMMAYPMDSMRFVNYYTTSLEKNYKHELFLDPFSAIPIDLVDPDTYRAQPNTTLAPEDLALLADDETTTRGKRSKVAPNVAWLRKTEYLTNEEKIMGRAVTAVGAVDKKRGQQQATAASIPAEEDTSEEGEIRRIDATFDEAREIDEKFARGELKHPTKPGIEVTEVLPVFPNFELYSNVYNIVSFDTDPIPDNIIHPVDEEKRLGKPFDQWDPAKKRSFRSRGNGELYRDAMIIPTDNDTALSYLMPKNKPFINKNTSNKKRRREAEAPLDNNGNVREYEWERDYTFRTSQLNGTYFFVIDPESNTVKYLNIETKFDLAKKKAKQGRERDDDEDAEDAEHHASQQESLPPSRVLVEWRDFNEEEKEHIQAAMADFGDAAVDAAAPPARRNGTSSSRSRNTSTSSRVVSRR